MILVEQDFQTQSMWPASLEKRSFCFDVSLIRKTEFPTDIILTLLDIWIHTHDMWLETIQLQNTAPCFVTCLSTRSTISIKSTNAKKRNSMHHWSKQKIKWLTNYHQLKWLIPFSYVVFIDKILRLTELSTILVLGGQDNCYKCPLFYKNINSLIHL